MAIEVYEVGDKMLENVVDVFVPAAPTVPCFNNSLVVAIDEKGGAGFSEEEKCYDSPFLLLDRKSVV